MRTVLEQARCDALLSHAALWIRFFELGGMSSPLEVEAYLHDALEPTAHEHDVLVHALNERFMDLGDSQALPYAED